MTTLVGQCLTLLKDPAVGGYDFMYGSDAGRNKHVIATGQKARDDLLRAKRYHLSSQTAKAAATYVFNVQTPVEDVLRLARAPFDSVWLEWPVSAQHEGVGLEAAMDAPQLAGNLIRQDSANPNRYWITSIVCTDNKHDAQVLVSPVSVVYDVAQPITEDEYRLDNDFLYHCLHGLPLTIQARTDNGTSSTRETIDPLIAEQVLRATLLGGSENARDRVEEPEHLFALTKYARWALTPYFGKRFQEGMAMYSDSPTEYAYLRKAVIERVVESSGMYRFAISALALLQQKEYMQSQLIAANTARPDEVGDKKSSKHATPNYNFVELRVPHTVFVRSIQGVDFEARKKARHEVAGHFCESHRVGDPNCEHIYTAQSSTRDLCLLCGSRRWWRQTHYRGDAKYGEKDRASRFLTSSL